MNSARTGRYPATHSKGIKRSRLGASLLVALLLLVGGCTDDEPETSGAPEQVETPSRTPSEVDPGGGNPPEESPADGTSPGGDGGGSGSPSGGNVDDPAKRRTVTGNAPAYVEIDSARLRDKSESLEMNMVLSGPVPKKLRGNALLRVNFTLLTRPGRRYSFGAQADKDGWQPFATGKDSVAPQVILRPESVSLLVSWKRVGGTQPLRWSADVSWVSGNDNAFDIVPEDGYAAWP